MSLMRDPVQAEGVTPSRSTTNWVITAARFPAVETKQLTKRSIGGLTKEPPLVQLRRLSEQSEGPPLLLRGFSITIRLHRRRRIIMSSTTARLATRVAGTSINNNSANWRSGGSRQRWLAGVPSSASTTS